jgi:peroxiredoxin family protein
MKGLKFSKTGWLILAAGVFIVVLAGLVITRSGQAKEQHKITADLATSQMRLDKMDTKQLQVQDDELQQQLVASQQQLVGVKDKLRQKITSVDVTDKLFQIASDYSVNVTIMGTTSIAQDNYGGIEFSVISVSASADGAFSNIVDFVVGLNNNFSTGFVQSAQLKVAEELVNDISNASITLIVYSYEGS